MIRGEMPGSGGYGDPHRPNPEAVLEDVRQEKISPAHAREAYGVVIDPAAMVIDEAATVALRKGMGTLPA